MRFIRGGVWCGYLMGRRGGQRLFLSFFSGSLRSKKKKPNHFQVQRVIPSSVIHTIPGFHESAIIMFILSTLSLAFMKVPLSCLYCLKLHDFTPFKPKIIWGRFPRPPPKCSITYTYTFYKAKTIISNVFCLEKIPRDVISIKIIVCKAVCFNGKNRFRPY